MKISPSASPTHAEMFMALKLLRKPRCRSSLHLGLRVKLPDLPYMTQTILGAQAVHASFPVWGGTVTPNARFEGPLRFRENMSPANFVVASNPTTGFVGSLSN